MRYRVLLLCFLAALCVVPTGSARAVHYGFSVQVYGGGVVTGGGINCRGGGESGKGDGECSAQVSEVDSILLMETPDPGQAFSGWGGDCSGTATYCLPPTDGAHYVSASFAVPPPPPPPKFDVDVTKAGSGTGYVGSGSGIDCGPVCTLSVVTGTQVKLTAVADEGSAFSGWSGGCSGTDLCSVTVTAATAVTATFLRLPPSVRALASVGVRGEVADLRYRLAHPNSGHREGMTVVDGKTTIAKIARAHTRLDGNTYFIEWHVPPTLKPDALSFCIIAIDPPTNQRAKSCARLSIS